MLIISPMDGTVRALRAITAELLRRKAQSSMLLADILLGVLLLLGLYLTTVSVWWWLLVAVLGVLAAVFLGLGLVVRLLLRTIGVPKNSTQKPAVRGFVDKLETVLEHARTPIPFLALRISWELLLHRKSLLVEELIASTSSLKPDFESLRASFQTEN